MSDQGVRPSLLRSGQVSQFRSARLGVTTGCDYVWSLTSEGHNSFVRTPFWVFLDSMESSLSQEFIHMLEEDIRCQTKVSNQVYRGLFSSVNSGQLDWV